MDFLELVQKFPSCSLGEGWDFFSQKGAIFRFWLVTILKNGNLNAVMRIRIDLDHLGSLLGAPSTEDT